MPVAEPHKELRFTRAHQARPFWFLACVCLAAAILPGMQIHEFIPGLTLHPAWFLLPLALGLFFFRLAWRLTRHAYILLSPIGVEIFPFFRPSRNLQVIPWGQIHAADAGAETVTLHFNSEKSAGIHLSLQPISPSLRPLLAKALLGRIDSLSSTSPESR